MTTDERIKEIEDRRKNFCRGTDEDHDFLLALVKVQREALGQINSNRYDPIVILDLVHRALSWKPEGEMQREITIVFAVNNMEHAEVIRAALTAALKNHTTIYKVEEHKAPRKYVNDYVEKVQ